MSVYCDSCGRQFTPFDDPAGYTAAWLLAVDRGSGWSIQKALQRGNERLEAPTPCRCGNRWARRD